MDYAANQGIEWVVLTNGTKWMVYRVVFAQPIGQELVIEFDFSTLEPKSEASLEILFMLSTEGLTKSRLSDYHSQRQAMSRFFLGAMLLSESVLSVVRRELKRVSPDVKIEVEDIAAVLQEEVIKREVIEGEKFAEAKRKIQKAQGRMLRTRSKNGDQDETEAGQLPQPGEQTTNPPA